MRHNLLFLGYFPNLQCESGRYKQIHELTLPTSDCYARSLRCKTGSTHETSGGKTMKKQITQISFEKSVLASLAVVTVATFGALFNAALNFQAFI